jgi:energy-coupling factor transporter transmembrane protein EcfT
MQGARPGKELLKVVLLASFLATLATVHCCNGVFWLSFLVEIALILVRAWITIVFFIIIITSRELIALLFFLVGPFQYHIAESHDRARSVSSEVAIELLGGEAIVEAVDDVVIGDVGDGRSCIKEPLDV